MVLHPSILILMAVALPCLKAAGLVKNDKISALEAELQELYNANNEDSQAVEAMEERLSELYNKEEEEGRQEAGGSHGPDSHWWGGCCAYGLQEEV
jgi:outer membrane murein-binding lipoprotein Lpp